MNSLAQDDTVAQDLATDRDAFLAERLTGIGGSDASSVVGINPYKSPYELYLEKRGEAIPDDLEGNEAVKWGVRLEDVVADAYAEETGLTVHRVNRTLRHPQHPFMMAHLDRRVVGQNKGLEVKTAGKWASLSDAWGQPGTDEVPEHYIIQVQHYMAVTGYDSFDLAVLLAGQDFRIYSIARNEKLIEMLYAAEDAFWRGVQQGAPPDAVSIADARRRFPTSRDSEIEASAQIALVDQDLRIVERDLKDLEVKKERLQGLIMGFMGDAETLIRNGQKLRTWKSQDRSSYTVAAGSSRVFRSCKIASAA